jgi:hypothetical protein
MSPGAFSNPSSRGDNGAEPEPGQQPPNQRPLDRRGDEEEPRQREQEEQRERADSVFGRIRRLLPRHQVQRAPYVFRNFPTDL